MRFTDPSGEIIPIAAVLIGAAIGGVINLGVQAYQGNINSWQDGVVAFGIGLVAGGVGGLTGGAALAGAASAGWIGGTTAATMGALGGAISGASGGAISGFIQGFGNALYFQDASVKDAFKQGGIGAGWGVVGGAVVGGATGYIASGKFGGGPDGYIYLKDRFTGTLTSTRYVPKGPGVLSVPSTLVQTGSTQGTPVYTMADKMAKVRLTGTRGEQLVGVTGPKVKITSPTGTAAYRIPDEIIGNELREVKNVAHLDLANQLIDFHMYAQSNNLNFVLYTRTGTTFSPSLQYLIDNGAIIHRIIPGL